MIHLASAYILFIMANDLFVQSLQSVSVGQPGSIK